jgi:hypothetical protein
LYLYDVKKFGGFYGGMMPNELEKFLRFYSRNIQKLYICYRSSETTIEGLHLITENLQQSNLLHLEIDPLPYGLIYLICCSFSNLVSLSLSNSYNETCESLAIISRLTKLEKIELTNIQIITEDDAVDGLDAAFHNFSVLTKLKTIKVKECSVLFWSGLSCLVANKGESLLEIRLDDCFDALSSEGCHCLTILSNLTNLTMFCSNLNETGLNIICCHCLLIEYLDFKYCKSLIITQESNFSSLNKLSHLTLYKLPEITEKGFSQLSTLSSNLTYLNILPIFGRISDDGLSNLSLLVNLQYLQVPMEYDVTINGISHLFPLVKLNDLDYGEYVYNLKNKETISFWLRQLKIDHLYFYF